jgi:tetratricopeptide (TPR) repeat protein
MRSSRLRSACFPFAAAVLLLSPAPALSQTTFLGEEVCGSLNQGSGVGPWDYNDPEMRVPTGDAPQTRLKLVENVHFKPEFERLAVANKAQLYSEFVYTLRVIPNHYRALDAVSRLERQTGKLPGTNGRHPNTADCWFDRAMRFRPRDGMVYYVFGIHNHALKRYEMAETAYLSALQFGVTTPQLNYNLGLLYTDMKQFDKAFEQAKIAYAGGIQLPALRERLTAAGKPL